LTDCVRDSQVTKGVAPEGLEPPTSTVRRVCSIHLSYGATLHNDCTRRIRRSKQLRLPMVALRLDAEALLGWRSVSRFPSIALRARIVRSESPNRSAVQRNVRIVENGSDSDVELFTVPVALPNAFANALVGAAVAALQSWSSRASLILRSEDRPGRRTDSSI
jgi:hypothetical protein